MTRLRLFLAAFVGIVVLASCERMPSTAPPAVASTRPLSAALNLPGLLGCTPTSADSSSAAIGPEGGTIFVGAHKLVVPAGALDSTVTITAIAPSDSVNRVVLEPTGLTFNQPATLTMSYANCGLITSLLPHSIAYIDSSLSILEILSSTDNIFTKKVSAHLHHFSDYAIAW